MSDLGAMYEEKTSAYQHFGNGPVARLAHEHLPEGGALLDIGCASGGLLGLLRERAGRLVGMELSASAADAAAAIADEVLCIAVDAPEVPIEPASFDVVVCSDVIEHTVEPSVAMGRAATWVRPGGHVIVSVPNIGFWQARLRVVRGRWGYDETGIFDSGHLRFFTVTTVRALVADTGLEVVELSAVVPALRNTLKLVTRLPRRPQAGVEKTWQRLGRRWPSLLGYQIVVLARRPVSG